MAVGWRHEAAAAAAAAPSHTNGSQRAEKGGVCEWRIKRQQVAKLRSQAPFTPLTGHLNDGDDKRAPKSPLCSGCVGWSYTKLL